MISSMVPRVEDPVDTFLNGSDITPSGPFFRFRVQALLPRDLD
jgi:hypothetical protein